MALVDYARIQVMSGKGGNGVIRWLRTKESARGGPSGGDGGRGGDVVLVGVRDLNSLARYRHEKKFRAENGEAGRNELEHGSNGATLYLNIPVGTTVRIVATGEEHEIVTEGQHLVLFRGGFGGKGNARFKSSTNQNPFQQTDGKEGRGGDIELTLKIIADAGFVGLPNAGKSSLLNALTRAKAKVGNYPFTTLEPNLGEFYGFILADIPGLIEGASDGRGVGIKFLKHVERTGFILHLVSAEQYDALKAYREVHKEIEAFGHGLALKREVIVLTKTDLVLDEETEDIVQKLIKGTGREVLPVTIEDPVSVKKFSDRLTELLSRTT